MKTQTEEVFESEGDAWFARNRQQLGVQDPVSKTILSLRLQPHRVLEVGCANGWRLKRLRSFYGCAIAGVDASRAAVADAGLKTVKHGCASSLPFFSNSYDLVIYGFCLYLCEPHKLLTIAAEGDRVLKDDGYLIIHDFADDKPPFSRPYEHKAGMLAYHMDFARLWLGHPWYRRIVRKSYPTGAVTVLQKRIDGTFPLFDDDGG